jgi:hypothetical protein
MQKMIQLKQFFNSSISPFTALHQRQLPCRFRIGTYDRVIGVDASNHKNLVDNYNPSFGQNA